jgi:hypothetical protein
VIFGHEGGNFFGAPSVDGIDEGEGDRCGRHSTILAGRLWQASPANFLAVVDAICGRPSRPKAIGIDSTVSVFIDFPRFTIGLRSRLHIANRSLGNLQNSPPSSSLRL